MLRSKGLSDTQMLTIDCHANQPATRPTKVGHGRMLELCVTVRAYNEQIRWVMTDVRIEMVDLKVRLSITLFEGKGTKLALAVMQLSKKDTNCRRNDLVPLDSERKDGWTRPRNRTARYPQQLHLGHGARTLSSDLR